MTQGITLTSAELKRAHPEVFQAFTNAMLEHYRMSADAMIAGPPDQVMIAKGRCLELQHLLAVFRDCSEQAQAILDQAARKGTINGRQPNYPGR